MLRYLQKMVRNLFKKGKKTRNKVSQVDIPTRVNSTAIVINLEDMLKDCKGFTMDWSKEPRKGNGKMKNTKIKNYLKELGIEIYERGGGNFTKSFGDNEIFLYRPLELEPFHEVLKSFDNHHWVHSTHWWSDTTEEDYPSRHPVLYKNGLLLEGTDFNDGRYSTFLFISNNLQHVITRLYSGNKFDLVVLKYKLEGHFEFLRDFKMVQGNLLQGTDKAIRNRFEHTSGGGPKRPDGCPRKNVYCNNFLCDMDVKNCYFKDG